MLVVVPGRVVVGFAVVVVDTRVGVGVVLRENAGRDQWPPLLVRVQLEPLPPLPQERRGWHPPVPSTPGTAVDDAAGGLPGGGQFCGGVMA